jgi:PEGA domain/Tetratricopeptide repeat
MPRSTFTAVVSSLAFVLAVPAVRAAPKPSSAQKQADRHFKSGVALFKEGKFKEALAEFERAYEIAPHPLVLYNIAGCHRELSSYGEAIRFYERFLAEAKGKVPAARLTAAQTELDGILARIARVTIVIQGPPYATLVLDGNPLGTMPIPMPLILPPGEHKLAARADGYRDAERTLRVASGDEAEIELRLAEAPHEPAAATPPAPTVAVATAAPRAPRRFSLGAGFGSNLRQLGDTGAPSLGLGVAIGSRLQLGVDGILVAYAVMPSVRVRIAGDRLSVHAIGALPIAFPGDAMAGDPFVAGAGGLGVRYRATPALALRLESLASYAGARRGTTFPTFLGGELWF